MGSESPGLPVEGYYILWELNRDSKGFFPNGL